MTTTQKRSLGLVGLGIGILAFGVFGWWLTQRRAVGNAETSEIEAAFTAYTTRNPIDLVYLHLDRPLYQPGEILWFQGYVRNAVDLKAAQWSEVLRVELLNGKKEVVARKSYVLDKGFASGHFNLTDDLPQGDYYLRGYTDWQRNDPEPAFFEKAIQIQRVALPNLLMKLDYPQKFFGPGQKVLAEFSALNRQNQPLGGQRFTYTVKIAGEVYTRESGTLNALGQGLINFTLPDPLVSTEAVLTVTMTDKGKTETLTRNLPIILDKLTLNFYAEGGQLIQNVENRIAFEGLNEIGKPVDVSGQILDSRGETVGSFASLHDGRGTFVLKPNGSESYTAKVDRPTGVRKTFKLPGVSNKGVAMRVDTTDKPDALILKLAANQRQAVSVVGQMRGKIYHTEAVRVSSEPTSLTLSTAAMPMGVLQLTVFDNQKKPIAERLVFVNRHKEVRTQLTTNKKSYGPREEVQVAVRTIDAASGKPVATQLSVAVVDDRLLTFADDKAGGIASKLMVESEIKGLLPDAKFYFDKSEPIAREALDHVLMTRGWRRYSWEQIIQNQIPVARVPALAAAVAGKVTSEQNGMPISGAEVRLVRRGLKTTSKSDGSFFIPLKELNEPDSIIVSYEQFTSSRPVDDFVTDLNLTLAYRPDGPFGDGGGTADMAAAPAMEVEAFQAGNTKNTTTATPGNQPKKAEELNQNLAPLQLSPLVPNQATAVPVPELNLTVDVGNKAVKENKARPLKYETVRKEFAQPIYTSQTVSVHERVDFRPTIFWNAAVQTNENGEATFTFLTSDATTVFRITAEGISTTGLIATGEAVFTASGPVELDVVAPHTATKGDLLTTQYRLTNLTKQPQTVQLTTSTGPALLTRGAVPPTINLNPGETKSFDVPTEVSYYSGYSFIQAIAQTGAYISRAQQQIRITEPGYPQEVILSGSSLSCEFDLNITEPIDTSLSLKLDLYPSPLVEFMQSLVSMIQEPHGCFEQATSTNYPNIAILQYLKAYDYQNPQVELNARKNLESGYALLKKYELPNGGFELFGNGPTADVGLTAYGLLQFTDMKAVYPAVEDGLLNRTRKFLLSKTRSDGTYAIDYAKATTYYHIKEGDPVTQGFITFAMAEAGITTHTKQIEMLSKAASSSNDGYLNALATNALFRVGKTAEAEKMAVRLAGLQQADGSFTAEQTFSHGDKGNCMREATGLAVLALLKSTRRNEPVLRKAVEYLHKNRGKMGYGSTQATVWSLKAIAAYTQVSKTPREDGIAEVLVDGKKVGSIAFKANTTELLTTSIPRQAVSAGKHTVRIQYVGTKTALPYGLTATWRSDKPANGSLAPLKLTTSFKTSTTRAGENLTYTVSIENTTDKLVSLPTAVIGIPGGTEIQGRQLKEWKEQGRIAHYELLDDRLHLYFYRLEPSATETLNLELRTIGQGKFRAPASKVFPYYAASQQSWAPRSEVHIQ
jgi:hypothetical protein